MKNYVYIIALLYPVASEAYNLVGGKYSSIGDGAVARARGATATWINPAGLAFEKSSSISSGASAYNYRVDSDNDQQSFSSSSTTSHVATIGEFGSYVFGFMLYTAFDKSTKTEDSNFSKNSEGYLQGSSSFSQTDLSQNYYIFSISPKESTWGVSVNIIQTNVNVLNRENSQKQSPTPTERKHMTNTLEVEDNFLMAGVDFGQQFTIGKKYKLGYKLSSPSYLLQGGGYLRWNSIEVAGTDANNATLSQGTFKIETKTIDYYQSERAVIGLAYYLDKYIFEIDISYFGGYSRKKQKQVGDSQFLFWDSSTDTYSLFQTEFGVDSGDNDHNSVNVRLSMEYTLSDAENYGFSIAYAPTGERGGKGMNELSLTSGYSKKYKNFLGSYGIHYLRGIDTGKNTVTDDLTNTTKKATREFESISLMVSGAYYF